jgi:ankyrin repeat protein
MLEKLLVSLPRSLDETYERMLMNIPLDSMEYAQRILTLLCCAKAPLTISELIDSVAVELGDDPRFNPKRRLANEDEVQQVCPGLIEVDVHPRDNRILLRIAHYSVQEYLESKRIRQQKAAYFGIELSDAHSQMASICLTYLLEPGLLKPENTQYPFQHYAARWWHEHDQEGNQSGGHVQRQVLGLFMSAEGAFENWVNTWNVDGGFRLKQRNVVPSPVYYASLLGLYEIVLHLLVEPISNHANIQGAWYGNPLQAASYQGHERVVQLLLEKGADVNVQGGYNGSALQAASYRGHEKILQLLLERGADVNAHSGYYGSALQAASFEGHEKISQLLLEKGADVNAKRGYYGSALQAASFKGNVKILRLLLERGADVNAQGGYYGCAVQAASFEGHEMVLQLLLERQADVNTQRGYYGSALQAASYGGHDRVVQLLLDNGADINAEGGWHGNALQAASYRGRRKVLQLLLERGANINAVGGHNGSALQAASSRGHMKVAQLLLEKGADVDAQGGNYGSAFYAALYNGYEEVVKLLLDKGAEVTNNKDTGRTPLIIAVIKRHAKLVRCLLEYRLSDLNSSDRLMRTALSYGARHGDEQIIATLLAHGIDPDPVDHYGCTPLSIAARHGHLRAVMQLISTQRVNLNSKDCLGRTPLWYSQRFGYTEITELLLDDEYHNGEQGLDQFPTEISLKHDKSSRWCDVCTLDVGRDTHYRCAICNGGDFVVCSECYTSDLRCLVTDHELSEAK